MFLLLMIELNSVKTCIFNFLSTCNDIIDMYKTKNKNSSIWKIKNVANLKWTKAVPQIRSIQGDCKTKENNFIGETVLNECAFVLFFFANASRRFSDSFAAFLVCETENRWILFVSSFTRKRQKKNRQSWKRKWLWTQVFNLVFFRAFVGQFYVCLTTIY